MHELRHVSSQFMHEHIDCNITVWIWAAKFLWVTISDDLHWHQQINLVAKKANTMLRMISHNLRYCPSKIRSLAYCTLVCLKLEYCLSTSVWDHFQQQDIDALEHINRRTARVVYKWERGVSHTALFLRTSAGTHWVTADDIRDCHSCTASPMGLSQCTHPTR